MATVKKIRRAQDGEDVPCPPGGGGKCRPSGSPRFSIGASTSGGKGRSYKITKEDEEEGRIKRIGERIKTSAKNSVPQSTAPGVRGEKKGKESFFGGDKDINEAKYGKKMTKIKKAQVGKLVTKKKAAVDSVESEMYPGKMIPKSSVTKGPYITPKKSTPKKKMKSGGSFPDLNKDGKITKADILKGRGVIKNGGKMAKKAKSGMKMMSGGKCKYGCK